MYQPKQRSLEGFWSWEQSLRDLHTHWKRKVLPRFKELQSNLDQVEMKCKCWSSICLPSNMPSTSRALNLHDKIHFKVPIFHKSICVLEVAQNYSSCFQTPLHCRRLSRTRAARKGIGMTKLKENDSYISEPTRWTNEASPASQGLCSGHFWLAQRPRGNYHLSG